MRNAPCVLRSGFRYVVVVLERKPTSVTTGSKDLAFLSAHMPAPSLDLSLTYAARELRYDTVNLIV